MSKFIRASHQVIFTVVAVCAVAIMSGCDDDADAKADFAAFVPGQNESFPVNIHRPDGPPTIELIGSETSIACSVCHSVREPNFDNRTPADLDEFHQDLPFAHGELSCHSCHNPDNYDALRLADGTEVAYTDVMTLCAQCHGTQYRDYQHGAHGGMNGYWDLTRGPRVRNNCVDCHGPHVPAFPMMQPTFKPRDRFLIPVGTKGASSHD